MEKTLTVAALDWSPEVSALIERAVVRVGDVRGQVETGRAVLLGVSDAAALVGVVVLRVDATASGREGVIVAASGRLPGVKLLSMLPEFENRFTGCVRLRAHTSRRGMVRELKKSGYRITEYVLEKAAA